MKRKWQVVVPVVVATVALSVIALVVSLVIGHMNRRNAEIQAARDATSAQVNEQKFSIDGLEFSDCKGDWAEGYRDVGFDERVPTLQLQVEPYPMYVNCAAPEGKYTESKADVDAEAPAHIFLNGWYYECWRSNPSYKYQRQAAGCTAKYETDPSSVK